MNWTDDFRSSRSALVAGALALALAACGDEPAPPKSEGIPVKPEALSTATPPADPYQPPGANVAATQPATSPKSEPPPTDPDKALAAKVKSALEAEPRVNGQGIDVTAADGVVSLWGTVADAAERRKAESVAATQPGVKSVTNKLVIVKGS